MRQQRVAIGVGLWVLTIKNKTANAVAEIFPVVVFTTYNLIDFNTGLRLWLPAVAAFAALELKFSWLLTLDS
jgi:hypothetical protein